jgi:site-specific recombinase XerD
MNLVALQPYELIEPTTHTLNWLMTHMDVSAETIADYTSRLNPFIKYLMENGVNDDTLVTYKRLLAADTSIKVSTKNKKLTVARIFLRELYRGGFITRDITLGVNGFQQSSKH